MNLTDAGNLAATFGMLSARPAPCGAECAWRARALSASLRMACCLRAPPAAHAQRGQLSPRLGDHVFAQHLLFRHLQALRRVEGDTCTMCRRALLLTRVCARRLCVQAVWRHHV